MRNNLFIYLCITVFTFASCHTQKRLTHNKSFKIGKGTYTQYLETFGTYLWYKNKDSVLTINTKNLDVIVKRCDTSEYKHFGDLRRYILDLASEKTRIEKNLTFPERAKVVGYVIEYLYRCQQKFKNDDPYKDSKFIFRVLAFRDNNLYDREFKKHDYYGLPLLKQEHLKYFKYMPELDEDPNQPIKNYSIE